MKLGPVSKLDKRKKNSAKTFYNDAMSENYDVIVIFQDYGQFGAIRKPDYIFINSNQFISQKLKTELKYLKQNSHAITF